MDEYINKKTLKRHYAWWGESNEMKQIFDEIIDQQPTVSVPVWRRGLPNISGEYIVMIHGASIPTALNYNVERCQWWDCNGDEYEYYTVDYWQPFPEPPRKGAGYDIEI